MATKSIQQDFKNELQAFGLRLRYWRKMRKLTQEKLANAANISYSFFNKLENGKKEPGLTTIYRLAKALDVDPVVFLMSNSRVKQAEVTLKLDAYPNDLAELTIEHVCETISRPD